MSLFWLGRLCATWCIVASVTFSCLNVEAHKAMPVEGYTYVHRGFWPDFTHRGYTHGLKQCGKICSKYPDCVGFSRNNEDRTCRTYTRLRDPIERPSNFAYTRNGFPAEGIKTLEDQFEDKLENQGISNFPVLESVLGAGIPLWLLGMFAFLCVSLLYMVVVLCCTGKNPDMKKRT